MPHYINKNDQELEDRHTRLQTIFKSNILIQGTRKQNFTVKEQKLILGVLLKITRDTKANGLVFDFDVNRFDRLVGLKYSSANFNRIKKTLENIQRKTFWITTAEHRQDLVSWFSDVHLNTSTKVFTVKVNPKITRYLINQDSFFTAYSFIDMANMNSKYSMRLYEIFLSYSNRQNSNGYRYTLKEIRRALDIPKGKYKRWYNFRKRVLDKAQFEINNKTKIIMSYVPYPSRRNVRGITVWIKPKSKRLYDCTRLQVEYDVRRHLGEKVPYYVIPKAYWKTRDEKEYNEAEYKSLKKQPRHQQQTVQEINNQIVKPLDSVHVNYDKTQFKMLSKTFKDNVHHRVSKDILKHKIKVLKQELKRGFDYEHHQLSEGKKAEFRIALNYIDQQSSMVRITMRYEKCHSRYNI